MFFFALPSLGEILQKESVGPIAHFTGQALVNRGEKQATVLTPVYIQTREPSAIPLL